MNQSVVELEESVPTWAKEYNWYYQNMYGEEWIAKQIKKRNRF